MANPPAAVPWSYRRAEVATDELGSPAEGLARACVKWVKAVTPHPLRSILDERRRYGSTVCINITSYADHSDRLKYRSLPDDQGWIIGA